MGASQLTPLTLDNFYNLNHHDWEDVIDEYNGMRTELMRMYEREDELLDALRIVRDDLDEAIAQGHLPIKSTDGIDATKIRNFANDASQ